MGNSYQNQRGESLVMVLAAVAIAGVVVSGLATYMNNMQKVVKMLETRNEALELLVELKSVAASSPACKLNFEGLSLPGIGSPLGVSRFRFVDSAGSALSNEDVVRRDQRLPLGTRVTDIALVTKSAVAASTFLADLRITFANSGALAASLVRSIRTRVQVDGSGRIVDCTFDENGLSGASAAAATAQACDPAALPICNARSCFEPDGQGGTMNSGTPAIICTSGGWACGCI